jgi:hypothetical protein
VAGQAVTAQSYPEFVHDIGELLKMSLPLTDRERDELFAAEAEVRRLKTQLAVAEERQSLARRRYDRERAVFREIFDTWRSEAMKMPTTDDDG